MSLADKFDKVVAGATPGPWQSSYDDESYYIYASRKDRYESIRDAVIARTKWKPNGIEIANTHLIILLANLAPVLRDWFMLEHGLRSLKGDENRPRTKTSDDLYTAICAGLEKQP